MNIGEAVKERILELCSERDISINKLCSMSGVTPSSGVGTVAQQFLQSRNSAMVWESRLKTSSILNYSGTWNRKFNRNNPSAFTQRL